MDSNRINDVAAFEQLKNFLLDYIDTLPNDEALNHLKNRLGIAKLSEKGLFKDFSLMPQFSNRAEYESYISTVKAAYIKKFGEKEGPALFMVDNSEAKADVSSLIDYHEKCVKRAQKKGFGEDVLKLPKKDKFRRGWIEFVSSWLNKIGNAEVALYEEMMQSPQRYDIIAKVPSVIATNDDRSIPLKEVRSADRTGDKGGAPPHDAKFR